MMMHSDPRNTVTAVAVSGGADSLFTLIRLQESGVPVIAVHGIFARNLTPEAAGNAAQAENLAVQKRLMDVCAALGVPLHVIDLSGPFLNQVVRPFVEQYAAGLTPNPCAVCNRHIKFGLLLDSSRALGAERIATGHYVRLTMPGMPLTAAALCPDLFQPPALLQGADPGKDQSYFLSLIPAARLPSILFPLGDIQKIEVIRTLSRYGIPVPQPGESRGVCFIPDDDYRAFVAQMAEQLELPLPGPGPMLLADNTRIGTHKGLWQYTEGQRHGLGVGWKEPLHVLKKETDGNVLRLAPRQDLWTESCECGQVNLLLSPELWPETVLIKTRYRETPRPVKVSITRSPDETGMRIRFLTRETAVAPGQVAAIYIPVPGCFESDGRPILRLVAGGIIR